MGSSTMSQTFSPSDVASHNKADNLWIIVDQDVYDLTKFQDEHPGGKKILQRVAGKDASKQFWKYHNESILKKYSKQLQVGSLDSKPKPAQQTPPTPSATPPPSAKKEAEKVVPAPEPGAVSPQPGPAASEEAEAMDQYGDMIPYADPSWYQTYHTPYFNETHAALRAEVREWMEEEVMPYVTEWDEAKKVPDSIYKQMGERGYLAGLLGMHPYPSQMAGGKTIKSVPPEKWDLFHEMLLTDEMSRCGSGGFVWNVIGGFGIGCPPVVKHGKKELVQRILPEILNGDKRICLAITEPDAGSDVANLTCEAKRGRQALYCQWREEVDHQWRLVRLLHNCRSYRRRRHERRLRASHRAQHGRCKHAPHGLPGRLVLRHYLRHIRRRQGAGREPHRQGEPRVQGHHDQFQPRTHRNHHPVPEILPRLLRREHEVCAQAEDVRPEAYQPCGHPYEAGAHGTTDRSLLFVDGELDLPMPEDVGLRGYAEARRCYCWAESASHRHFRVLRERGQSDLRRSEL